MPPPQIVLKTRSEKEERSEVWRGAGFVPASTYDGVSPAPYVVFSAPPTGRGPFINNVRNEGGG